eukprot:20347_1
MATSKPTSPISPGDMMNKKLHSTACYEIESVGSILNSIGLNHRMQIAETLQGSIWRGTHQSQSGELISSAIKIANKDLHQHGKGVANGIQYAVHENIITEKSILKYLTAQRDCPSTIVRYRAFYESNQNYYFVMEFGGSSLFSFVQRAHQFIQRNKIDIHHWQQVVQVIFKQMIDCIAYIHSKNICHFDVSLENFLVNDIAIRIHREVPGKSTEKITFVLDDICVKLCDFGLAQFVSAEQCKSTKFCGKPGYKSPEIVKRKCFDAKKNDIWSLGVCLFMMAFGCGPWSKAATSDAIFAFAMKHSIRSLLNQWNVLHYVNKHVLYLLHTMLQYESNRISSSNIQHFVHQYM